MSKHRGSDFPSTSDRHVATGEPRCRLPALAFSRRSIGRNCLSTFDIGTSRSSSRILRQFFQRLIANHPPLRILYASTRWLRSLEHDSSPWVISCLCFAFEIFQEFSPLVVYHSDEISAWIVALSLRIDRGHTTSAMSSRSK